MYALKQPIALRSPEECDDIHAAPILCQSYACCLCGFSEPLLNPLKVNPANLPAPKDRIL